MDLTALTKQIRLSNLIALATYDGEYDEYLDVLRGEALDALCVLVPTSPDDEHPEVRPEIAFLLGLGDSK